MMDNLQKTIEILSNGGVVIFPTDTVFGLGCRIDNEEAIKRIFKIKKREENMPLPVLVDSLKMAEKYLQPLEFNVKQNLIKKYWPGGLTIVAECKKKKVLKIVRSGQDSLAVRMPNDFNLLKIINKVGVPIIGTSANFHGQPSSFRFEDLDSNLLNKVDFTLSGICKSNKASTIIDIAKKPWRILRQGGLVINF